MNLTLGAAGLKLGVSGGDLRRAGFRRVSQSQLEAWQASPPAWQEKCRARKERNAQRAASKIPVLCSLCGVHHLRTLRVATRAAGYLLVCSVCERRGLRPELATKSNFMWTHELNLAGGFAGWKPYVPPSPGSLDDRAEFTFRAFKEGVSDAEARREWNRYKRELANQSDDQPSAEIIALHVRSVTS